MAQPRKLEKANIKPSRLAKHFGISTRTVKRRILRQAIPAVPLGGGRYGLTLTTFRTCAMYGLDAFQDDEIVTREIRKASS